MLTSFEIKNFRTFKHLRIERLGRVNLIVGKNNVGKTTLLEALRVLGSTQPAFTIRTILDERNEVRASADLSPAGDRVPHYAIASLVHGRVTAGRIIEILAPENARAPKITGTLEIDNRYGRCLKIESPFGVWNLHGDGSAMQFLTGNVYDLTDLPIDPPPFVDMSSGPLLEDRAGGWWGNVWLSPQSKARVLDLLKTLPPQINDAIFVPDPRNELLRFAKAQVADANEEVPLAAMGGGAARLFYIALAMEFAAKRAEQIAAKTEKAMRDDFAFVTIDEVESGVHHSLHGDLWRFVFRAARELDVQVFAATHSWDCLRGFAEAVAEDEQNDGLAIRLETLEGHEATRAVVFDRDDLPIVVRDSIEVR